MKTLFTEIIIGIRKFFGLQKKDDQLRAIRTINDHNFNKTLGQLEKVNKTLRSEVTKKIV